jgi:RluA family pseudouridine synthase
MPDKVLMEIIHIDTCLLIVNKPAGMPVLPDGWDPNAPYLVKLLEEQYSQLWVVHRLDKVTSGTIVFARTAKAHRALNLQFERREAQKVYHAILNGEPKWAEHIARHPLRVNVGHSHRTMVDDRRGKPCETRFKVLKRYKDYSLVESTPATGRTHQIRVHAYALGYPLLGDLLYSASPTDLIARPALHALSLTLAHPESGERMTFAAAYADDFNQALCRLDAG